MIVVSIMMLDLEEPPTPRIDASGYALNAIVYAGDTSCRGSVRIWSITKVPGGVTGVDLVGGNLDSYAAYVQVFSGFGFEGPTALPVYDGGVFPPAAVVRAPVMSACPGDVLVSSVASCGRVLGNTPPFSTTDHFEGTVSGAMIADEPGGYGGVWDQEPGAYAAVTVVFH